MRAGLTAQDGRRLVGYARVSTPDQKLDLQLDALKAAGCDRTFHDEGVSGGVNPADRPGYMQAYAALDPGSVLVVWKTDRLCRSTKHLIDTLDHFKNTGIEFISLTEAIDTTSALGRAFWQFIGLMAELERGLISERTREGMEAARRRGVRLGRPPLLDEAQRIDARRAILFQGLGFEDVARGYGVSVSTVRRAVDRICLA